MSLDRKWITRQGKLVECLILRDSSTLLTNRPVANQFIEIWDVGVRPKRARKIEETWRSSQIHEQTVAIETRSLPDLRQGTSVWNDRKYYWPSLDWYQSFHLQFINPRFVSRQEGKHSQSQLSRPRFRQSIELSKCLSEIEAKPAWCCELETSWTCWRSHYKELQWRWCEICDLSSQRRW